MSRAYPPRSRPAPPRGLHEPLPNAVRGHRHEMDGPAGRLNYYRAAPPRPPRGRPLLLVHSINAAAAAHEVEPLVDRYAGERVVYAPDLPGYGHSERRPGLYTPRHMTDALLVMLEEIAAREGPVAVDGVALSLSCEFLARAALERPDRVRSLGLVAPTGFNRDEALDGSWGSTRGRPGLYRFLAGRAWSRPLFDALTSRPSVRFFLEKTWGRKGIDRRLFWYSWRTAREPGAHHAPYSFLSGYLFSGDISRVYEALEQPVWMVHGVRGDFTDYRRKRVLAAAPNWRIEVFQTGALPHFEATHDFVTRYERFLAAADTGGPVNPDAQ